MSFYVKSTPEVANFYGFTEFNQNDIFLVCSGNMVGVTNEYNLKHHYRGLPEYKLHPKHGFVPACYSEDFLDSVPYSWSSTELPKKQETKQQNEKLDQKGENENMNRKENFPVVGQKVVIDPNLITYCPILKDCVGKEVIVIAKYKYYNIDTVSVCLDEFSGVACVRADCCFPVKTEQEKNIDAWVDLLSECDTLEDVATVLVMNGYHRIKSKD